MVKTNMTGSKQAPHFGKNARFLVLELVDGSGEQHNDRGSGKKHKT